MPTKIEWTGESWNPIRARTADGKLGWHCEHSSPGCANCYAETQNVAQRFNLGTGLAYKPGHRKDAEVFLDESALLKPLGWRKGREVFVCSMTDLFGDFVTDAWIDRVFAVMALCPQHTFQVLTKRSGRMLEYLAGRWRHSAGFEVSRGNQIADTAMRNHSERWIKAGQILPGWPLPNVWLGVSVEDQQRADERIPDLLATPAAGRWISAEPLLGPVDLGSLPWEKSCECVEHSPTFDALEGTIYCEGCCEGAERVSSQIDWVVAGGESGPNARPMHPDWARALRDQCAAADVPFFFKQWGEFAYGEAIDPKWDDGTPVDPALKPVQIERGGKKRAGRLLDGTEHNAKPEQIASGANCSESS